MSMTSNIYGSGQDVRVRRCRAHPYPQQAIPKYVYILNNSHRKLTKLAEESHTAKGTWKISETLNRKEKSVGL